MKQFSNTFLMAITAMLLAVTGCTMENDEVDSELYDQESMDNMDNSETAMNDYDMMQYDQAVALIHSNNSDVSGWVTFTKVSDGVRVQAEVTGLTEGDHGIHIHKFGDCRADDYSSAGPHFNPADEEHGAPTDSIRHMGDTGNITANAEGIAEMDYVDSVIEINRIIGRGVIVHQGADDFTSQPSGAAGPRIACGVIGIAEGGSMENSMNNNMNNDTTQGNM